MGLHVTFCYALLLIYFFLAPGTIADLDCDNMASSSTCEDGTETDLSSSEIFTDFGMTSTTCAIACEADCL